METRLTYTLQEEDQIHNIRMVLKLRLGCSTRLLREARDKGDILCNGVHVRLVENRDPIVCHDVIDSIEKKIQKEMGVSLVIHYDPPKNK